MLQEKKSSRLPVSELNAADGDGGKKFFQDQLQFLNTEMFSHGVEGDVYSNTKKERWKQVCKSSGLIHPSIIYQRHQFT